MGSYIDPFEKINFTIRKIYQKLNSVIENDTFNVHLSGDGMQLTKTKLNLINFTFKILNENNLSPNSIYTLGNFFLIN